MFSTFVLSSILDRFFWIFADFLLILKIGKVWIAPGCIVCNACEEICPEVFDVQEETCVIKPEPDLELVQDIVDAAEACPVEVIKFQPA